jgi:signal transduction histidine kinase
MNRQIDEIADFVKERPPRIEKISSSKLIESTLKNTPIPDKTQVFLPNSDITLYGDFTQLETVLSNIITNSIQAIDGNGTITVSVKEEGNFVEIAISDSGPGIPNQNMEKIFEPLFTTKNDGTGLGLSSCQTIIENHGGKITVHNNPTTFTLHIPKKESKITLNN